jgi:hypothetical protein
VRLREVRRIGFITATRIKKLQFGNFIGSDVRMAVAGPRKSGPDGWPDFVAGEDILSRFTTEFDFAHQVIRMLRSDGCQPQQLKRASS